MGGVTLIWFFQIMAAITVWLANRDPGRPSSDLGQRFRRLFRHPLVINIVCGLIGFTLVGAYAARQENFTAASSAATSFWAQSSVLCVVALSILFGRALVRSGGPDMVFGSARFARIGDALEHGLIGESGIRLGRWRYLSRREAAMFENSAQTLHYTGERHLLTIAPTRAGKGVSTVVPNLLTVSGSVIVIDPKGENAAITHARRASLGDAFVLDPWGITGLAPASFNPLDILVADSPTLIDDAFLIADALVIPDTGGQTQFWSDQARAIITGFLLYLATEPAEADYRHLGRLRDILSADPSAFADIGIAMSRSPNEAVRAAAARILSQNDETRASILSTAQQNTHFLDSPSLRGSLTHSTFQFADLKRAQPATVYIVLPVDRIGTYSRWLRLLIALGIAQLARVPNQGARPVLFLLDEFAQLGKLQVVEDAYGLMAGMGLQLHAIVQDLSQLDRLYPGSWQTFLANSGAIQVFGTRDLHTAEYFSKMLGQTTAEVQSYSYNEGSSSGTSTSSASGWPSTTTNKGTSSGSTWSRAPTARPLLFPDELMRMNRDAQLLFIENSHPVLADKIVWHQDPAYRMLAGLPATLTDATASRVLAAPVAPALLMP